MDPLTLVAIVIAIFFAVITGILFVNRWSPKSPEEPEPPKEPISYLSPEELQKAADAERDRIKSIVAEALTEALDQLEKRNKSDFVLHNTHVESIQKAVRESLKTFQTEQSKYSSNLVVNVESLTEHSRNLSSALRSTTGSGQWGEMQLERVAELGGMVEHCDFDLQKGLFKDDGTSQRPDMIVHLPSIDKTVTGRIAVDSKASLQKFMDANEAENESTRKDDLKEWNRDLRKHVKDLSNKKYWESFKGSLELVVMFLPGETMFSAALQEDPDLIEYALERNILLASPITLISLLQMLAYGWRQVALAENAEQIRDSSEGLFNVLKVYVKHLKEIRVGLGKAVGSFNAAVGSWQRTVYPKGEKLLELKVSTDSAEEVLKLTEIDETLREIETPNTSGDS